jgi:hypothetical protein
MARVEVRPSELHNQATLGVLASGSRVAEPRQLLGSAADLASETEALIEEARRRARRRRYRGIIVAAVIVAGAAVGYAAGGRGTATGPDQTAGRSPVGSYLHPTVTARIQVGPAEDLVASRRVVWVAEPGAVVRVDAGTGRVVGRIRTPAVGEDGHIAVGNGSVWVTAGLELGGSGTVYRIDPSTDRVVATVRVGGVALGIAVGAGRVWVARVSQGPGEVVPIDPRTNTAFPANTFKAIDSMPRRSTSRSAARSSATFPLIVIGHTAVSCQRRDDWCRQERRSALI